jgi:hypothetical protein
MSKIINNLPASVEFVDSNGDEQSFPKNLSHTEFVNSIVKITSSAFSISVTDITQITSIDDDGTPVAVPADLSGLYDVLKGFFFRDLVAPAPGMPLNVVEVFTEANFGIVDPGVKIDVTPDVRFKLMNPVTVTLPNIIATGANMEIVTTSRSENFITYTNVSEPMFQGVDIGTLAVFDTVIEGNNTGSLLDIDGGVISFKFPDFNGWDNLGTVKNLTDFFAPGVVFDTINGGLSLTDCESATIVDCLIFAASNTFNFFEIAGRNSGNIQIYDNIMIHDALTKFCRLDPGFNSLARFVMRGNNVRPGQLFDVSGATGTFTAVADNSIGATGITSVSDSSGIAQFNHAGTSPLLGSTVTISGFITNTSYNITGIVSVTGASSFELKGLAFGTDEATGSYLMNGITVTSAAHGLSNGEGVVLDVDGSTDYNDGGHVIYNVQTNTFDVAEVFTSTHTGDWSTEGLDQSNQRVFSVNNPDQDNTKYVATAFVNNNATVNGAIVNNTFRDITFGTGGSALIAGSTMERWKLIDEVIGIFEYTGNEPFSGRITFDVTSLSSGGTVDFRYKWVHDVGAGFIDLDDSVEVVQSVGASSANASKTFPLNAVKGDQIKPQITRNSGSSSITTQYSSIFITQ